MTSVMKRLQWGLAAAHDTAVPTDTYLIGTHPQHKADRKPELIEEDLPVRSPGMQFRSDTILIQDTITLPNAYFQVLPIIFSMGLVGGVAPAEQTPAQNDMLWTHTPSETASNTPDSGTLELGDEIQAYETHYMMISRIKLSGDISQDMGASPVAIEFDYFAKGWSPTTFTGGLSMPTTTRINAKLAQAYIDSTWANVGTTKLTNLLRKFELEIDTGLHPSSDGSDDEYMTVHDEGNIRAALDLTLRRGTVTDGLWDDFQTGEQLKVARLQIKGPQIGTGEVQTLTLDVGGDIVDPINLVENDRGTGLDSIRIEGRYDTTGAKQLQATCITDVAAI